MSDTTLNLTEDQIQKYQKRAKTYVTGSGKINPKWLDLSYITSDFLDTQITELSPDDKIQLYPFEDGVTDELKFRILNIQLLCCNLAVEQNSEQPSKEFTDYTSGVREWVRELLTNNEKLRNKLKIQWEPLGSRIANKILKDESKDTTEDT